MTTQPLSYSNRSTLSTAWIISRREIRDSLRDWRIVTPIILLTLVFPFIMDFTSRAATNWVTQYAEGNLIIAERLNPFLLMIVGFFPISFSLIIALESFVGEKERNSLEPILSMPVSDLELYLGKMVSSVLPPLMASYLGITVFLISRALTTPSWIPPLELAILVFLLTTVEALVMVSGAVVISSQTTSVRAANLLASFIIIPMAFLVQAESVIMFWAEYEVLWWILIGLLVVNVILIRMGIRIFNREEILSKELDELSLKRIWRDFKGFLLRPPELAADHTNHEAARFNLARFYLHDIPMLLKQQILPFAIIMVAAVCGIAIGIMYSYQYQLPPDSLPLDRISAETFDHSRNIPLLGQLNTRSIATTNIRVVVLAAIASLFSFGALTLLMTLANAAIVTYLVTQIVLLGHNPWLFILTFLLPHGILEIPSVLIGLTFALRIGAGLVSPPENLDVGQGLLLTTANFLKLFVLVIVPVLILAAFIEANITPQIVLAVYSG